MTHKCMYHGRREECLLKNKFPVTKNNKLNCSRVHAAEVYGSKGNKLDDLKENGLCKWVYKCTDESEVCPGR